jgi:WD repeat-containing protein 19
VVPILTSTVIQCQRAGLRRTALEHACTLMRPEYRSEVPDKYRKKIELMVRKPDRGDEPPEGLSPCPYCSLPGPECQLQCVSCQSIIPFDIATGACVWCACCAGSPAWLMCATAGTA